MALKIVFFLLFNSLVYANTDAINVESKVKNDLSSMISKIISADDFFLSVNSIFTTRKVREVVEGESIIRSREESEIIPPMPGFELKTIVKPESKKDKQVYKIVEKKTLKSIFVQLTVNKKVISTKYEQIRAIVSEYLNRNYPGKASLSLQSIEMKENVQRTNSLGDFWKDFLPWILGGLFLLILAAMILFRPDKRSKKVTPSKVYPSKEQDEIVDAQFSEPYTTNPSYEGRRKVPALPANERYIDMRSELLKIFSENSDIFRVYFQSLSEDSKKDIVTALKGPAFSSLTKTLNLKIDLDNLSAPPAEESLNFYCKDFKEFVEMHRWQRNQFFGFLHQLTHGQLLTLFKDQNSMIAALMLKYLNPDDAAKVLDGFDSEKRMEILSETSRVDKISSEELSQIEEMVRSNVEKLPKLMLESNSEDSKVWSEILSKAEHQEELLKDIEKVRPELYPSLAKYKFKMEDLPGLPAQMVNKVIEETDNEKLAMAFAGCSKEVVQFAFKEVGERRKSLLESQIESFRGLPPSEIEAAKQALVYKFREEMV